MDQDIKRIGIGNVRFPTIVDPITDPEDVFSFDSEEITFDSMMRTFDEDTI